MTTPKLTEAQRADLARLSAHPGSARTGIALWRLGLVAAIPTTGIRRGPTVWRTTCAGDAALRGVK